MPFLIRKIEKGKWLQNDIFIGDYVSADAITNCIKTKDNCLSTWKIDIESDIDYAVMAIVSNLQHLDAIDVVCISQSNLIDLGLLCENTQGNTAMESFVDRHVDVVNLNYNSLGAVARCIVRSFEEKKVIRYTRLKLKNLLKGGLEAGSLNSEAMSPSLLSSLE